ncbi:DUF6456 domain-containing protein [Segnochrobactraceae bacterium EtOH-i3]
MGDQAGGAASVASWRGAGAMPGLDEAACLAVLRALADRRGRLAADGLLQPARGAARQVEPALLVAMERADLLAAAADGALVPTAAGRAKLRRALAGGDAGFRAQHGAMRPLSSVAGGGGPMVDLKESPLGWLARRGAIAPEQLDAGERLRADFTRGQMMPSLSASWAPVRSGGGGAGGIGRDLTDAALEARLRVERALAAVGPELSGVLVDVCCLLKGLEAIERERTWPARSGKIVLGLALTRLAAVYGLSGCAEGPETGRLRASRVEAAKGP